MFGYRTIVLFVLFTLIICQQIQNVFAKKDDDLKHHKIFEKNDVESAIGDKIQQQRDDDDDDDDDDDNISHKLKDSDEDSKHNAKISKNRMRGTHVELEKAI